MGTGKLFGCVLLGALAVTACSDTQEEAVQLKGLDSTLAAEREVDRVLAQVAGNTDSVYQATQAKDVEAVVAGVKVGMSIRGLPAFIGTGPMTASGVDTLKVQDGYRRAFVVSPPDLVTVIWYRKTPGTPSDPIQRAVESPIVLKNDVVVGSGWAYYDQVRTQLNLPEVPKS